MKIFIVVLNFNSKNLLANCLKSLKKIKTSHYRIVVDNNSSDGSLEVARKSLRKDDQVIKNKKNLGFAKGNNVGIRWALAQGATHVLLLNPDTDAENDFLSSLIKNPGQIVAPVIKYKNNGKWIYDLGGFVNYWIGKAYHAETTRRPKKVSSPGYVSGACMLISRKVFEEIGFFDERFFLYFEDADFCLRAKKAGFKVNVEPGSIVVHSLEQVKDRSVLKNWHLVTSNLLFINKHAPFFQKPTAYAAWIIRSFKILANGLIK